MGAGAAGISAEYRLLGLVGQGQFSQVYCAIHRRTGRVVAIKHTRHPSAQRVQEPFVLYELDHPNVMGGKAVACGPTGYQFVLEYCEGGTLRSHLNTAAPIPLSETKALIGDILKGLSHVHQQRIIHGDLKPENILLTYAPRRLTAKIGDFSSACFVELPNRSRQEIGSPTYAAPERFEGQSSYAADLYSVGVMLYEMLLGDRPFSGSPTALQQAHKTQPVPLPNTLTHSVRQLLATALHKQPDQRFVSAEAMLSALQQLSAQQSPRPAQTAAAVPTVSVQQSLSILSPKSSDGKGCEKIVDPIEHLLTIPQGCCLLTARSLYLLTAQHQLVQLAAFEQAQWIAVSPNGRWCLTLPKQSKASEEGIYRRLFKANSSTCNDTDRPIYFQKPPLDEPSTNIVQLLAIDTHHILRIRSASQSAKTYLECFTRRGQFVAQRLLNLSIIQATLTTIPYQLLAIASSTADDATVVLIMLKPFTIRQIRLSIGPQKVSALPWGYAVTGQQQMLLLDRLAEPVSLLADLPAAGAIAAIGDHTILLSARSPTGEPSTLYTVDLKRLDLGLIF